MSFLTMQEALEGLKQLHTSTLDKAIEYLQNQPTTPELISVIVEAISNVYKVENYDELSDEEAFYPLWLMVVAEKHLVPELAPALIELYTSEEDQNEYINEQGLFLIGALCNKLGAAVAMQFLEATLEHQKQTQRFSIYLTECLWFVDKLQALPILMELLKHTDEEDTKYLLESLAANSFDAILPLLKAYDQENKNTEKLSTQYVKLQRELQKIEWEEKPYFETRGDWKEDYKDFFKPKPPVYKAPSKETDRNAPCPCGSGKKYKKCCMNK